MRQDAFVVNVSRPELVDEAALIAEIESGHLSGAALDVFESRNGIDPRLLQLARDNPVVLTAHMASATLEARLEMERDSDRQHPRLHRRRAAPTPGAAGRAGKLARGETGPLSTAVGPVLRAHLAVTTPSATAPQGGGA